MIEIGIDPSLNSTGIVISGKDNTYIYHIITPEDHMTKKMKSFSHSGFSYITFKKSDSSDENLVKSHHIWSITNAIKDVITPYITQYGVDNVRVTMEGVSYGSVGSRALVDLSGLNFAIRCMLIDIGVGFRIVPPTSWKKEMTGNGQADKAMITDIWMRLQPSWKNAPIKTDDIADAYFLCRLPWS